MKIRTIFAGAVIASLSVMSCKKETSVESSTTVDSLQQTDTTTTIAPQENPNAFSVEPIQEQVEPGKTVFTQNSKTLISFDTRSNTGVINIDGQNIPLKNFSFQENQYEISGDGIKIKAENGNFDEMTSDCTYGAFPKIVIDYKGHQVEMHNIKVQDCPSY